MKKKRNLSIFAILVAVVFAFGGGLLLNSSPVSNIALTSATAVEIEQTKVENEEKSGLKVDVIKAEDMDSVLSSMAEEEEVGERVFYWFIQVTSEMKNGVSSLSFSSYDSNCTTTSANVGAFDAGDSIRVTTTNDYYASSSLVISPTYYYSYSNWCVHTYGINYAADYDFASNGWVYGMDWRGYEEYTNDNKKSAAVWATYYSSYRYTWVTLYVGNPIYSYDVSLSKGTGISSVTGGGEYNQGSTVTINASVKTGYTWKNWTGYTTTTTQNFRFSMPSYDVSLTANATANTYSVKYNANGGSGTMSNSSHTYDTAKNLTANAFTRTGYTFAGWATSASGNVVYADKASVKNLTSINDATYNLYAKWNPITYSVKYNANGGSGTMTNSSHTYDTAKNLTANAFTRTGYTFAGWATSSSGSVVYADKASVKNLTSASGGVFNLYAKWTAISYTVVFNGNGHTGGSMNNQTFAYDETKALSSNGFTKSYSVTFDYNGSGTTNSTQNANCTFKNWAENAGGSGATYSNGQSVSNLRTTSGNYNLYAQWNTASVTFPSGGDYTGYNFLGWASSANATSAEYQAGASVTITQNTTFYAVWELAETTLSFDINGGDESTAHEDKVVIYGQDMPLLTGIPTRTGYTFVGYSYGGVYYYNSNLSSSLKWNVKAETATLVAEWTANTYTISYFDQGGTPSTATNSLITTHTYDIETILTDAEKTGYLFKGFYKDINCETQQVSKILATETTQNITLYIKWQAITYQVEYNKNNATSSELMTNSTHTYDVDKELSENIYERVFTVTYIFNYAGKESEEVKAVATFNGWAETASGVKKYNDKQTIKNLTSINEEVVTLYANFTDAKITLLSPTRDSHNFTGWKLNDSTTYNANQQITPSEDITLTAQWEIKTYSITYYGNENDAGTAPSVQVKNYDEDITISGCGDLSKIGHDFMAWNTKADGKGTTYAVGANYALNADLQLFAIWNPQVYNITYLDQGGDDFSGKHSGAQPTTHTFGTLTILLGASNNGYDFKGWFNNSDCTGTALTTLGATDYTTDITLYAKFDAQVYDIIYKDQGGNAFSGTHESGYPIEHTFGTDTPLKTASKTGYDFKGWYSTSDCTGNAVGTLLADKHTANIILYAKWDIQSYTITLEQGEGISSVGGAGTYNYGASVTISADLALGYSWKEWQQNDETYQVLQTFNFIIGTENVTFKAIATLNTYNITYDLVGGEVDGENPATYTVKDEFTLINPTKIGYTFAGWTYGDVSTPVVEMKISPNTIAENLDFVANWNPNTDTIYRIHYYLENLNNEEALSESNCTLEESIVEYGTTGSTVSAEVKTYEGFISPTQQSLTILADGSAEISYFYTRKILTLTLENGEGIASVTGAGSYEFEEEVTINAELQDNYNWAQWTDISSNTAFSQIQNHTFTMVGENLTLRAEAVINSITIYFDNAGGTGNLQSAVYDYNSALNNIDSTDLPTKTGYNFQGYFTAPNGEGEEIYNANGQTDKYCTFTIDTTIYAHWEGKTYTVTYSENLPDGFVGGQYTPISTSVVFGNAYPVLAEFTALPEKTAYNIEFIGWSLTISGELITNQTVVSTPNDHTLYAQWEVTPIEYIITFSSGKGYTITAEKDGANFLSGQTANITNTIIFTITALNGYENAQLSVSGGSCTFDNNILSNVCDNIQISGSVTLIEYDITYNLRGGNVTPANPATYTIEDTFTLNNPTKYGYDFKGWVYEGQTEPQLEVVVEEGTFGDLEFTANYALTPAIAPVITTQPIGGQTPYGISLGLSVVVSGAEGHILTYQWFKDGELIDGATEDVYTTDNTIPAGEINEYQVIITATREDNNLTATATSNIAEVEITFLDFENVDVSGSYDGIYTGETRSIVVTTATLGATIEYSMDNATWQTEIIKFINATNGPQTIYWQITKANYNTQNGSEIINIVQAPNGWTVTPNIDGWVYGEPNSPSGESTFGEIVFTYSIKDVNDFKDELPTDAGNYTMRAEVVETENFEGLVKEVDFTIEQREVTIVWGETSFTYDGTPKIPTATAVGLLNSDVCEVDLIGKQIEVSITSYTATAIGLTNTNYKLPQTGVTIKFYIYYEKISGIEVISYSGIYDKLPHSVLVQGALANDAIYYSEDNATWQTEPITRINAGITTLYVKVTRTNFADFVSEAVTISISQATLIKPIALTTEFNYNGELQSYIPNGFDIETMNISNHEQIMANENGYNVLVEIKDKVNYTWEDSTQIDLNYVFVIHKLNPTIITQPTYSSVYSGQKLSDVEIIGGTMTTAGEFSWEHPNTTLINGENDVALVFTPNDLENCNIKIMQVVVTTTQIQLTFDVNDVTLGAVTTNELYVDYGTILTINENVLYIGSANVIAQTNIIPGVFIDFVDFTNAVVGEITAPVAITANFEIAGIIAEISARNYFSQNTNGVVGGSIVFEGKTEQETTFETNTEIKVLATPEAGYELHHWLVNGDEKTSTALNTLVLTAENEALEIIAVFKGKQVKLNLDGGENADIQDTNGGNKNGEYYHVGDIIEVNALAHTGYIFNNEWIHSNLGEIEGPYYTLTSDDAVSGEITLRAITFSAIIQVDFVINGGGNVFVEADTWNEIAKSYTMSYNSDILASFTATERYAYDDGSIKLDNAEATTLAPYVQSDVISITHDKYNRASKITITLNFKEQKWDDYVLSNMIATLPGNTGYKVIVDFDFDGDGTKEKPYTIESSEQFALLSFVINNQVLQSDNEKLAYNTAKTYFVVEGKYDFSERFWMPIGTAENPFNAVIKFEKKPTGIHLTTASQALIGIGFDEDTIEKYDGLFGYFGADAKVNPNDGKGSFLLYVVIAGVLALIALGIFLSFLFNKKRAERKASKNVMNTSRASQLQDLRNQFKNDYDYDDDD